MSGPLKKWWNKQKDSTLAFFVEKLLRSKLDPYGKILRLEIDSHQNRIELELLLNGENDSITACVQQYEIVENETGTWFEIRSASASREWITVLLRDFVVGKPFQIPDKYARVTRMLL